LLQYFEWGRFEMGCLIGILAHNWTEASFKGLSFSFFIFFLLAVRYRSEPGFTSTPDLVLTSEVHEDLLVSDSNTFL
jgi:hypothetical protein